MRVPSSLCFFVLFTSLFWFAPPVASGAIREDIAGKFSKRYQEWKDEFLSTEIGREQWERHARNPHFTLTITISRNNRNGGETSKYKWDDSGALVAATITLGDRAHQGYPNPIYYPVLNSLSLYESSFVFNGNILAAAKIAHEFGHVNRMTIMDGALYRLQHRLISSYNTILLSNGYNTRDPRLVELERQIGGTPVEIWENGEYWGEANAMLYLRDRASKENSHCALFRKIKRSVELYAKSYAGRFVHIAQSTTSPHPCRWH